MLDDRVVFPTRGSATAVVVDRENWTVSSTLDLGGQVEGSQPAGFDGTSIYVILEGSRIAVIDPGTFETTEIIEPFNFDGPLGGAVPFVVVSPGAIWVVNARASILQRFDRPT